MTTILNKTKLVFIVCLIVLGESTLVRAADDSRSRTPKSSSVQQVLTPLSMAPTQEADAKLQTPLRTTTQEERKQMEQSCAWQMTVTGCEPLPGSLLSSFPLVSRPILLPTDQRS